jgi:hypothetical protein
MNRFILFVFSLFLSFSIAIAQDGINYQGAATDANGDELTNQNITLRASVLSVSASGNLEWEETHSATTDQFGLFNVVIGQGTNTTNGATANFDDMDWGSGNHFLKIEMDASGGTNYAMIGTTQMMSVPYALYAKSAGIDSTMLANMIGSSGGGMGGGCDYQFPEGYHGDPIIIDLMGGYTVPSGKNLYITSSWRTGGTTFLTIGGVHAIEAGDHGTPMIAKSGDIISWATLNGGTPTSVSCMGILVDQNPQVEIISIDLMAGNYTVPSSKKMVLYHAYHEGATGYINVNGQVVFEAWNRPLPSILNAGDLLSMTAQSANTSYTSCFGYLVDENYFAGCGGGGGSSTASAGLDSATVAAMIASAISNSASIGIGDYYAGGIVGYIFQPGDADYIAGETHGYTVYSENTQIEWGCMNITTNVTSNNIGQGSSNTTILANLCPETTFAAKWCEDLVVGSYNDWFLPTYNEASIVDDYFYQYNFGIVSMWISEEFYTSNSYNYNTPSCSSDVCSGTINLISGNHTVGFMPKNYIEHVVAFRQF